MEVKGGILSVKHIQYENIAKKVYIIGSGGFGREVAELIETIYLHDRSVIVAGFLDDIREIQGTVINGIKVIGYIDWMEHHIDCNYVCAIGNPLVKKGLLIEGWAYNNQPITLVHPRSNVCMKDSLGRGIVIQAGSNIAVNSKIEDHVHINFNCTIGHDVKIGKYTTISPHCAIGGETEVGKCCFLGTGAIVYPRIKIEDNVKVGAGSVVHKDVPSNCTVIGNPCRIVKKGE